MTRAMKGFTIIELVVTLVVLGVLASAGAVAITNGVLAFPATTDSINTLSKLRVSSERIAREIRNMRKDPALPANYDITTMDPDQIVFTTIDGTEVTIRDAAPAVTLSYDTVAGTHVLTNQVSSLGFQYFRADGSSATDAADVAFVELELVLTGSNNASYPQRTRIGLRNQQ